MSLEHDRSRRQKTEWNVCYTHVTHASFSVTLHHDKNHYSIHHRYVTIIQRVSLKSDYLIRRFQCLWRLVSLRRLKWKFGAAGMNLLHTRCHQPKVSNIISCIVLKIRSPVNMTEVTWDISTTQTARHERHHLSSENILQAHRHQHSTRLLLDNVQSCPTFHHQRSLCRNASPAELPRCCSWCHLAETAARVCRSGIDKLTDDYSMEHDQQQSHMQCNLVRLSSIACL